MSDGVMPPAVAELYYRVSGAASGLFPGHHRSRSGDAGFEFRGHAALHDAPDVRRLDLHASLRDPFGAWQVRLHSQRKAIPVVLVADLSASMGFGCPQADDIRRPPPEGVKETWGGPAFPWEGAQCKLDVLADLVHSLAWSAWRTGDSFGFVGCDERVRADLTIAQTRRRGAGLALARTLRGLQPTGRSARALGEAHRHLPSRRALVFLVSDFHLPLEQIDTVLKSLALHEVVPVVLWQPVEFALGAVRGLAQVQEPEGGTRQWLWWRPALRERWREALQHRRDALQLCFRRHRLKPLFIEGPFEADAVTRHFLSGRSPAAADSALRSGGSGARDGGLVNP